MAGERQGWATACVQACGPEAKSPGPLEATGSLSIFYQTALTPTEETHLFALLQRMDTHFTIASDGNPFL